MDTYSSYDNDRKVDWASLIDEWGWEFLGKLGIYSQWDLPTDYNVITRAIKSDPYLVATNEDDRRFNRTSLSRLATICQMVVYDNQGGPEGDGRDKALRRHWYAWYKVNLAEPLSQQYGEDPNDANWGPLWAGRLSTTYAGFVDNDEVTYHDLWIEDGSRMIKRFGEELFRNSNIVIAVEKDSLFPDFEEAGQALGAKVLYSGKGKSSKAAIEKVLRENFEWPGRTTYQKRIDEYGYEQWEPVFKPSFDAENPLIILHISDYDYDGERVIGPTFAEQARRYTPYIREARVGVGPDDLEEKGYSRREKWYQVKVKKNNRAYVEWAEEKALFLATCENCGQQFVTVGAQDWKVSPCCSSTVEHIDVFEQPAHGFEVESMRSRDYRSLLVYALLWTMSFDDIVEKLRHEMVADTWSAVETIKRDIQDRNESYADLLKEISRLEDIRYEFEQKITEALTPVADTHKGDFWNEGDDPYVEDFVRHVERGSYGPWRPFDTVARTTMLTEFLREDQEALIDDFADEVIEW